MGSKEFSVLPGTFEREAAQQGFVAEIADILGIEPEVTTLPATPGNKALERYDFPIQSPFASLRLQIQDNNAACFVDGIPAFDVPNMTGVARSEEGLVIEGRDYATRITGKRAKIQQLLVTLTIEPLGFLDRHVEIVS